jgi:hypothetical protein
MKIAAPARIFQESLPGITVYSISTEASKRVFSGGPGPPQPPGGQDRGKLGIPHYPPELTGKVF